MTVKDKITQELEQLDGEQLHQVAKFIALLRFKSRFAQSENNLEQFTSLYAEFAQEDSQLAEEGMSDYVELLHREDNL